MPGIALVRLGCPSAGPVRRIRRAERSSSRRVGRRRPIATGTIAMGATGWSCLATADHAVDCVYAPAFFLASRRLDAYPIAGSNLELGADATPDALVESLPDRHADRRGRGQRCAGERAGGHLPAPARPDRIGSRLRSASRTGIHPPRQRRRRRSRTRVRTERGTVPAVRASTPGRGRCGRSSGRAWPRRTTRGATCSTRQGASGQVRSPTADSVVCRVFQRPEPSRAPCDH